MAYVNYADFVADYLVKNGDLGDEITLNAAPDQLKKEMDEVYSVIGISATNHKYNDKLGALNILDMVYDVNDNLTTVRYFGDNDFNVFYRDVLSYNINDSLVTVKHFYNTADIITPSAFTTLTYDVNENLLTATYQEL